MARAATTPKKVSQMFFCIVSSLRFKFSLIFPLPSGAEHVFSDCHDNGTRPYPLVGRRLGIVIINTSVCGVPAVKRVLRGSDTFVVGAQIDLTVGNGGKSAGLIYHPADCVGETAAFYSVEDDCRNGIETPFSMACAPPSLISMRPYEPLRRWITASHSKPFLSR